MHICICHTYAIQHVKKIHSYIHIYNIYTNSHTKHDATGKNGSKYVQHTRPFALHQAYWFLRGASHLHNPYVGYPFLENWSLISREPNSFKPNGALYISMLTMLTANFHQNHYIYLQLSFEHFRSSPKFIEVIHLAVPPPMFSSPFRRSAAEVRPLKTCCFVQWMRFKQVAVSPEWVHTA